MGHPLNDLAKLLAPKRGVLEIIYGVVLTYTASTTTAAAVLTCDFEGQGYGTPCIFSSLYTPVVGDSVFAISDGVDTIVISDFG